MNWKDFDYSKWKEEDKKFDHKKRSQQSEEVWNKKIDLPHKFEELAKLPRPPWKPNAFYNKHGKQIEIYLSDDSYYAKWINPQITLYLSFETNEIVGVCIEGADHLIEKGDDDDHRDGGN